jgi:hypothetical protein
MRKNWGTVDILNELRELKHPDIVGRPLPNHFRLYRNAQHDRVVVANTETTSPPSLTSSYAVDPHDAYIRLEETKKTTLRKIATSCCDFGGELRSGASNYEIICKTEEEIIKQDLKFVNHYLEESFSNGGLYWIYKSGISTTVDHMFAPSLSTYY